MKSKENKFNILDVTIIISVIAVIFSAYCYVNYKTISLMPYKSQRAIVTLITDDNIYNDISINDKAVFYDTDRDFGKILSVVKRQKFEYVHDDNGILLRQRSNDKFEYVLRIQTDIKKNETGIFTKSGVFCANGSVFQLKSKDTYFSATVDSVEIK